MTDQIQRLFDGKAATWPQKYAPGGPLAARLVTLADEVLRHAPPRARLLDLGCGTGELARYLAAAGLRAVGCDISRPMLRRAATGGGANRAGWVQLGPSWRRLPFPAATFDAVVASSVLEYAADPAAVLAECARVLRPGGVAVCTVPDLRHPVRWLEWLARQAGRVPPVPAVGRRWPRYRAYLAYLRASRQRHRARWWLAAARRAGLRPVRFPGPRLAPRRGWARSAGAGQAAWGWARSAGAGQAACGALRTLVLHRSCDTGRLA